MMQTSPVLAGLGGVALCAPFQYPPGPGVLVVAARNRNQVSCGICPQHPHSREHPQIVQVQPWGVGQGAGAKTVHGAFAVPQQQGRAVPDHLINQIFTRE